MQSCINCSYIGWEAIADEINQSHFIRNKSKFAIQMAKIRGSFYIWPPKIEMLKFLLKNNISWSHNLDLRGRSGEMGRVTCPKHPLRSRLCNECAGDGERC